jgi:hypothetical protein
MLNNDITKKDILEPLEGAIDYLDKLIEKKHLIVEPIENENYNLAFKEFENMINGIDVLNTLLLSVKSIEDLELETMEYRNENLLININDFNNFLSKKLVEAMKNEDYQLVADLLTYEFEKNIEKYKLVFKGLEKYFKGNYKE